MLIGVSAIKLGNKERQIWIEAHSSSRPNNLILNALVTSWIAPATFATNNSSKLFFKNVSTLQRTMLLAFTTMATTILLLIHLSAIALLLNLTDLLEPSTNMTVAR
jgi:hypothetical protein